VVTGHGHAELNRLRAELEELIGKPVQLSMMSHDGPPKGRKEIQIGSRQTAD
jgi:cell wall assembly regulator SMI1